jgi:hypothetical protein
MQHHIDLLQRGIEPRCFAERKNAVFEMMLFREFLDRDRVAPSEDRLHTAFGGKPRDQFAGITVGPVYEESVSHKICAPK